MAVQTYKPTHFMSKFVTIVQEYLTRSLQSNALTSTAEN